MRVVNKTKTISVMIMMLNFSRSSFSIPSEMTLLSAERKPLDSTPLSDMAPTITTATTASPSADITGSTPSGSGSEDPELRMLEKREKVVDELLQTEQDYIKVLQMCVLEIVQPLQQKQVGGAKG